ncbi:hypothetical protein F01_260179 [Burkholderia cenocepacia]|nr:hypothetical protein F01_260179 [Burkholderia cenocepacia]
MLPPASPPCWPAASSPRTPDTATGSPTIPIPATRTRRPPCTARSTSGAVAADATGIAAGATTITGTAIAATAATAGGAAADAAATGTKAGVADTVAATAAGIATDAQLQPFVSTHGPPMAGGVPCRGTDDHSKDTGPRIERGPFVVRRGETIVGGCRPTGTAPARTPRAAAYQPAGCA